MSDGARAPPHQTLPLNPQTSPAQNSGFQPETAKHVQNAKNDPSITQKWRFRAC